MKRRRSKKAVAGVITICIVLAFFLILMPVAAVSVYEDNFGRRFETAQWVARSAEEFAGLEVEMCTFPSNRGQLLAGYQYEKAGQHVKGVAVLAHGFGGGGHNTYMDLADYFTANGYLVFAYDATGNDRSEGSGVGGLPQGVIDLDYALRYVKQMEKYRGLPIVLFGHSWGGYCAGSVLRYHPDVKAAVLAAGFDRSTDLFRQQGASIAGPAIHLFMPYVALYERWKFGEYAAHGAMDGFAVSKAGVMVIHSRDDTTVLPENGFDRFYARYGGSPRFRFVEYTDRGHDSVYRSDASRLYREQLNRDYTAYVEARGGQHTPEIKMEFAEKYRDNSRCYELDSVLMEQIVAFYDVCCGAPVD